MTDKKKDYSIFGGDRFIESMRSGGYKDTSYAIGEIVDNAIDAKAKHVEIICQDAYNVSTGRYSLTEIAILDDGQGMTAQELRSALLFGDGTRGSDPNEIGKYGMGLPNSSLSQCKRVEVYSWQNGSDPICSYIDVDKVKLGKKEVPEPQQKEIPSVWKKTAQNFSKKSGTLVVWSKLDRCSWTTSKKIMEHSQFLIGRIYRRFLTRKTITIQMTKIRVNDNGEVTEDDSKAMLPNDPMYLISPSSTPSNWGNKSMFKQDTVYIETYDIDYSGQKHTITVKYSLVKDEVRTPENNTGEPGRTPHGKHARKNVGVSIMRVDREITLDTNLTSASDARERWWGVEMDIPSSLDLVVGLTNNKQQTDTLSAIMNTVNQFIDDDSDEHSLTADFEEQDSTKGQMFRMVKNIHSHIRSMQRRLRAVREGVRTSGSTSTLETKIDSGIRQEVGEGITGQSDKDRETISKEQRIVMLTNAMTSEGTEEPIAKEKATRLVMEDRKITFDTVDGEGSNFFSIENTGGILRVKINANHRAYRNLLLLTEHEDNKELSNEERLSLTKDGLWLLIASWARYEDLIISAEKRKRVQDIRYDWGRELDLFLEQNEH